MLIDTLSTRFVKTHATDATDTSFPSKIPTATEPFGDGVIVLGSGGSVSCNGFLLLPIGTGANNAVMDMRVIGWKQLPAKNTTLSLWVPIPLLQVGLVFGNIAGVANTPVGASYFFMDTVTLTLGNANVSNELISPAGASLADIVASIIMDVKGMDKAEVTFDLGANATGGNCLVAKL